MADHPVGDAAVSFRLFELAEATGGRLVGAEGDFQLHRLVIDSREATGGALFVALLGETTDGHRFVDQAIERGAAAVLCQAGPEAPAVPMVIVDDTREALVRFTRHQLHRQGCKVVGITGSVGKTSTKEMAAAVLGRRFEVLKTEGNLNTYTGLPMSVAGLEPRHQVFVAEYAMSALGEIQFLTRMAPPDVAIVLNVGLSHVGLLGSVEAVAQAKRELVEGLVEDGVAILNADDTRVAAMASAAPGRVLTFGLGEADIHAADLRPGGLGGTTFWLQLPGEGAEVRLPVAGAHAVSNALAAAAAGHVMGIPAAEIAAALGAVEAVSGRGKARTGRLGSTVIDDAYNASPSSMAAALEVLLEETARPRIAVLGEMLELGDRAAAAHREVGRAASGADFLVAIGEHANEIAEGAREGGLEPDRIAVVDSAAAAAEAVEARLAGALVLVKASRGMALEEVVDRLVEAS
jgi:UDP-N-acetylmuramoyl-tripeptide--D-alanyl-D-alanine ligase